MAALGHHVGAERPPRRPSFEEVIKPPAPRIDEEADELCQKLEAECRDVAAEMLGKESELDELVHTRMGAPYPYSLLIVGPRGVGKTALFIQLERQLMAKANEMESTARRQRTPQSQASPAPHPAMSPTVDGSFARPSPGALGRGMPTPLEAEVLAMAGMRRDVLSETPSFTNQSLLESPPSGASQHPHQQETDSAYAHREWRRSKVNLQTIQLYLAAVEGASLRPWVVDLFLWDVNDPQAAETLYFGAKCVCLMYDCTVRTSFLAARELYYHARRHCGRASFVLIGNKSDLRQEAARRAAACAEQRQLAGLDESAAPPGSAPPSEEEVARFCKEEKLAFFECSALDQSSVGHVTAHVQGQVEGCTRDPWAEEGAVPGSAEQRVNERVDRSYARQLELGGAPRRDQRRPSLSRLAALRRSESLDRMRARFAAQGPAAQPEAPPPAAPPAAGSPGSEASVGLELEEADEVEILDVADFGIGRGPNVLWPRAGAPLQGVAARQARRAAGLRALFDAADAEGRGWITPQQLLSVWEFSGGESEDEVVALASQFREGGCGLPAAGGEEHRIGFPEFGMLMLRLRPAHGELFLFPTRGESAFSRRPGRGLLPHYKRICDTFGESLLYPSVGRRTELLRPSPEQVMRALFNSFRPLKSGLVAKADLAAFLIKHGPETEKQVHRMLATYTASPDGMLSYPEFAMVIARVTNPLCDPVYTPFMFRCRGTAEFPDDQSRVPLGQRQLRRLWRELLQGLPEREGPQAEVPLRVVCDWILSRDWMGTSVARDRVRELAERVSARRCPDEEAPVGFDTFATLTLKLVSNA
eukprot:TRINITY_DN60753_c0_g1_i1.p1 TRINITY_DN60753_c0_g1~~TRINITY_DN60753_c0_g1_i1.p1  ORF type:complete len:847 (+),score=277.56 TRINITY_DN60753_c0_g1_i1:90-2543(+)